MDSFKCVQTLLGHHKPVQQLAVAGNLLFSAASRTVRAWHLPSGTNVPVVILPKDCGSLAAMAVGSDGVLYVGGQVK